MNMTLARPSNPLSLVVLALLFERPMHPYEMGSTLKKRRKEDSIKLRYGSLYTVIEQLVSRELIAPEETSREGRRPERTVYTLTASGLDTLRDWMRELLRAPVKEYPQFEAGLCLLAVLPPEETAALLRQRMVHLASSVSQMETHLAELARQDMDALMPASEIPSFLKGRKFPPLFAIEDEYRLAINKAELEFISDLVCRIEQEGWGPVDLWRNANAEFARQHAAGAREARA
jgi:DNA-binding PadR family transcriptional regulator